MRVNAATERLIDNLALEHFRTFGIETVRGVDIDDAIRKSRKLAAMRDYLLPKLLSGAVRVRADERMAKEVV